MIYDGMMDKECIAICDAINAYPGFETFESCSGHGKHPFWIWFTIDSLTNVLLPIFVRGFNRSYNGWFPEWTIQLGVNETFDAPYFLIEGPVGDYEGAEKITEYLQKQLKDYKEKNSCFP